MSSKAPLSWILLLIAIAGVVAALILTSPTGPLKAPSTPEEAGGETTPREDNFTGMMRLGPNAIYLDTQTAGIDEVLVGIVAMEQPGFVVIHADDNGTPGEIIGFSTLLTEGGQGFTVSVDRPLVDGGVYYAVLYTDDGDGMFGAKVDSQVVDAEGSVILMTFEAQEGYVPEDNAALL